MKPVLFADSNVLIQALFIPQSAAYVIAEMAVRKVFDLATCQLCVDDTEDAIITKLKTKHGDLDKAIRNWEKLKVDARLCILPNPDGTTVQSACDKYIGVMRHRADIPVLAAALMMKPRPHAILSGNREHFNNAVAQRCSIPIFSLRRIYRINC